MKFSLGLFLSVLWSLHAARADTTWVDPGPISGDWTVEGSPYMLEESAWVEWSDTLTIHPGVDILINGPWSLVINGRLRALGTADSVVRFTCDTTISPNGWAGLTFWGPGANGDLRNAMVHYVQGASTSGALYCDSATVSLVACDFDHNMTGWGNVRLEGHAVAVLDSCTISGGQAGCGAALRASDSSRATLNKCTIKENHATDGGAFCLYDSYLSLQNCIIHDNYSSIWGGVIYAQGVTTVEASDCVFQNNHAATGGVYFGWPGQNETQGVFVRCQFIGNYANPSYSNAASVINPVGDLTVDRCTFFGNGPGSGGAIRNVNHCRVRNSIFAYTLATFVLQTPVTASVEYCDFFGNQGENLANPAPGFGEMDTVNANEDSCDVYFNLFLDPLFADTASGNCHLQAESPCIDAGDPALPHDPDGTIADIGALYFDHPSDIRSGRRVVRDYGLIEIYPNPFNSSTQIRFDLPRASFVTMSIYDLTGRLIETLASRMYDAGTHSVAFNGENRASGVYVVRFSASDYSEIQKIMLIK